MGATGGRGGTEKARRDARTASRRYVPELVGDDVGVEALLTTPPAVQAATVPCLRVPAGVVDAAASRDELIAWAEGVAEDLAGGVVLVSGPPASVAPAVETMARNGLLATAVVALDAVATWPTSLAADTGVVAEVDLAAFDEPGALERALREGENRQAYGRRVLVRLGQGDAPSAALAIAAEGVTSVLRRLGVDGTITLVARTPFEVQPDLRRLAPAERRSWPAAGRGIEDPSCWPGETLPARLVADRGRGIAYAAPDTWHLIGARDDGQVSARRALAVRLVEHRVFAGAGHCDGDAWLLEAADGVSRADDGWAWRWALLVHALVTGAEACVLPAAEPGGR